MWKCHGPQYTLPWNASPHGQDLSALHAFTTAFAMECGKCSSIQAARRSISSGHCVRRKKSPLLRLVLPWSRVPVLSNTMVSASATASRNLPPLTVILYRLASRIADSTEIGIASFKAQEKSTISTASAFVAFLVSRYTRRRAAKSIRNQTVCQMFCFALQSGFQFLGILRS